MKKRNSLIELYRFFFALNVVKNHAFFPVDFEYFGPGGLSVEFFFILSGYFFAATLEKIKDKKLRYGIPTVLVGKFKSLAIPLIIGILSNIIYNIINKDYFSSPWSYLWYIESMLIVFVIYAIIRRAIKRDKVFFLTVGGVFVIAAAIRFCTPLYSWGDFRSASAISLGMLLSKLPKLEIKRRWIIWVMLIPIQALCFAIVCFRLADLTVAGGFMIVEFILDTLLYPALIYLTFNVSVSSRILNYLGALSFGLYAFQCPARLVRMLGVDNRFILLGLIVALTVIYDLIMRIIRHRKTLEKAPAPSI